MPTIHERTHESAASHFLDPQTLARIASLDLLARTVVEGFISGLHRSPYLGRSIDFAEHRAYMPGDDIRRIDWRLFARSDRFYVKEFEADTNTNLIIILDVSGSMNFSTHGVTKLDYGRYLAACLAYFSHKQRDRIGLVTFDHDVIDFVPPSAKHLEVVLHTIHRTRPGQRSGLRQPLLKVADAVRRRSILVLISDFYEEPDDVMDAVKLLRYKGSDLIAFHLLDPAEIDFPFERAVDFEDLETSEVLPVRPDYLREQYRRLIRQHTETLAHRMGEAFIDYTLIETSTPLDFALYNYLSNRQRAVRVR